MCKKVIYFENGLVDISYMNLKKVHEDNIKIYTDILFSALDYIENNRIFEIYLPKHEYINLEFSSQELYDTTITDVISTINSMIFKLDNIENELNK